MVKKQILKWVFSLAAPFGLIACNNQMDQFVRDSRPKGIDVPQISFDSPMAIKVTPAKINGSAEGVALQGTITPTNQKFSMGNDHVVMITTSRSRVQIKE